MQDIVFVGEAWGKHEERESKRRGYPCPFIGASGDRLNGLLNKVGSSRSNVTVWNVLDERPENNNFDRYYRDGSPTPHLKRAWNRLKGRVEQHKPKVVVPLGREAMKALIGFYEIHKHRGSVYPLGDSWVVPTYHPSLLVRGGRINKRGVLTEDGIPLEPIMFMDFNRAFEIERRGFGYIERKRDIISSYTELFNVIRWILNRNIPIAVDIETEDNYISCLGFATDSRTSFCIPLQIGNKYCWKDIDRLWRLLSHLLRRANIIGQNFYYDISWLKSKQAITIPNYFFDTIVAMNVCYPELPQGLDFMASIFTDIPYYKDDGKEHKNVRDYEKLYQYNCSDTLATYECYEVLNKTIDAIGQRSIFDMEMRTAANAYKASSIGFKLDHKQREKWYKETGIELEKIVDMAERLLGKRINLSSFPQTTKVLYDEMGLERQYSDEGKLTVNENALKRLEDSYPDNEFIKLLMRHRKIVKIRGTYLVDKTDEDGRFRCSYGWTKRGRLRSYQTPFNTGGNLQNIPHKEDI